jgi:predicted Zn-dependent protease
LSHFLDGNYPVAETYLLRATKAEPRESDPAALLAETQLHLGRFPEAETSIRHAIKLKPYKPGYRRVLALALEGQGRIHEAIVEAQAETKADPLDQQTQSLLARLKEKLQ